MRTLTVDLIRHGQTPGNALRRYIGKTDEPLSEEGKIQAGKLASCAPGLQLRARGGKSLLAVSPMLRCVQTAALLLGDPAEGREPAQLLLERMRERHAGLDIRPCEGLRECDFGAFEGKNYRELSDDPLYQQWIDSGGTLRFPQGEEPAAFRARCVSAFSRIVREMPSDTGYLCVVAHGGTIMSVMQQWGIDEAGNRQDYYQWHVENGSGLRTRMTLDGDSLPAALKVLERIGESV